jgi:hypothetical protein
MNAWEEEEIGTSPPKQHAGRRLWKATTKGLVKNPKITTKCKSIWPK